MSVRGCVTAGGDHGVYVVFDLCVSVHICGDVSTKCHSCFVLLQKNCINLLQDRLVLFLKPFSWKYAVIGYGYSVPVGTTTMVSVLYDPSRILARYSVRRLK